jgi:hypothetical protein
MPTNRDFQMVGNHLIQRHKAHPIPQRHKAGQGVGHLHASKMLLASLWIPHHHRQAEAEVGDVGKRMAWIHRQGGEHWKQTPLKVVPQLLPFQLGQLGKIADVNALFRQLGHQFLPEASVQFSNQGAQVARDLLQLLLRCKAIRG